MIYIKSPEEIELMRPACRAVAVTLRKLRTVVKPGISTLDLDRFALDCLKEMNAKPAFLNYNGYPATLCVSVNEEIVHGIPSAKRILKDGDIVSMDMGAIINGFYGDAAITVPVGTISGGAAKLIEVTERSLEIGLSKVKAGARLGDVSSAIGSYAEAHGMGVIEEFTGHGVGRSDQVATYPVVLPVSDDVADALTAVTPPSCCAGLARRGDESSCDALVEGHRHK